MSEWTLGVAAVAMIALIACTGPQGPAGLSGPAGPQGSQGIAGSAGEPGAPGDPGLPGQPGQPGQPGNAGLSGEPGAPGNPGLSGEPGPSGEKGARGSRGLTGPQGLPGEPADDISNHLAELRDAIVFIRTSTGFGSGVRISANEILTAQHVIGTQTGVNISVKGEGLVFATVKGYDTDRDIALLTFQNSAIGTIAEIPATDISLTPMPRNIIELGSDVTVVAYVSDISETTPLATFGRVGVIWSIVPGEFTVIQIDAAATNGMSGGGVFNSYGELVGILLSGSTTFDGNVRALAISEVREVIGELRSGIKR